MKLLVIGGGGREHAIISKLSENPSVKKIYAAPGNGGIAELAECLPIKATDIKAIRDFAVAESIDFVVVAPDDPLVLGAVDLLQKANIPCFGPNKAAAEIEGSKVFAKNLMQKYGIPTADFQVFDNAEAALASCRQAKKYPLVIKADGLALGKGVLIAENIKQAEAAIISLMQDRIFGASGSRIVVEEFLTGPEVSVLCFTDGQTIVPMVSAMDHKRALDGDLGLNTGGMGVIAPNPFYTPEIAAVCQQTIFEPTIKAMAAEGRRFRGCLYFGLMLTADGAKVIEYNCRFGDPEAQTILPLLQTDLLTIMQAIAADKLPEADIKFSTDSACCVVLASGGYPEKYPTGLPITIGDIAPALLFQAGTKLENGRLVTAGGRVLNIVATAPNLTQAVGEAYLACEKVHFDGCFYRRDIGLKAALATGDVIIKE